RAHAPVDVSGVFERMDEWSRLPPPSASLPGEMSAAIARVAAALPGPFDVVVSCCMLTQLQLVLVQVVGDANPRFEELRTMLGRIHVRLLGELLAPGGVALLVTDLTGTNIYPPFAGLALAPGSDLASMMADLLAGGHVIHAAHPGLLSSELRR